MKFDVERTLPFVTFSSTVKNCSFYCIPIDLERGSAKFSILVQVILGVFFLSSNQNFLSGFKVNHTFFITLPIRIFQFDSDN
jgi:hypothetical protein